MLSMFRFIICNNLAFIIFFIESYKCINFFSKYFYLNYFKNINNLRSKIKYSDFVGIVHEV